MSRSNLIKYSCILAGILVGAGFLLGSDFSVFLRWYLILLLLGFGMYPLTAVLFDSFEDHGWIFSKVIATVIGGYIAWLFVTSGLQQFTSRRCIVVTLILFGICWVWYLSKPRKNVPRPELLMTEEILFLAVMLVWAYMFTFRPEAMGTEKFMDYGFMASMERSMQLPAKDMWYGLAPVNYYYGGQYLAVYLSKFSYLSVRVTYNLMRAAEAAFVRRAADPGGEPGQPGRRGGGLCGLFGLPPGLPRKLRHEPGAIEEIGRSRKKNPGAGSSPAPGFCMI